MVVDALSRKSFASISLGPCILLLESITMNVCFTHDSNCSIIANFQVNPILLEQVKEAQKLDEKLVNLIREVENGENIDLTLTNDSVLLYQKQVMCPQ